MDLKPGERPKFLGPSDDNEIRYPGVVEEPTFDQELIPRQLTPPRPNVVPGDGIESLPDLLDEPDDGPEAPSRGYMVRRQMIAQLHARGYTGVQIGRHLGYSSGAISNALRDPWVKAEIEKERARLVDEDAVAIMKTTSVHAAKRLERTVLNPQSRNGDQVSQFILEKVTGKPKQEISHEHGSLTIYLDMLKGMQSRGEIIDVTAPLESLQSAEDTNPPPEPAKDEWTSWLKDNL
jgi:hypothetical protein